MAESRVCIIGAGPGGLASSILLARGGMKVTVLERLTRVGGRTATLRAGDFKFDIGPTFFLYPKVLRELLASAGYDLDREVPMRKLDPQYRLVFGAGGELAATPDVAKMEREIANLAPRDALGFRRFCQENKDKLKKFEPILSRPFLGWQDFLATELIRALPLLRPWNSLNRDLERYFRDPRIRLAFSFQSKYLGMSPFRCPSLFSILSFLEYEHGVFHPIGGCGAMTAALARIAVELGVDIKLGEPVEEIEFVGKRPAAVLTPEGRYPCDALVINADFAQAMKNLVPDALRRRWCDRNLGRKRYSCSTFMMYLGIDGVYDSVPHHNVYISSQYEQNLRDIEQYHVLSEDPSFYVQNACVTDPGLAPKGKSTLYVLVPVPHQNSNVDWSKRAREFRARALKQLPKVGIQDVERRIVYEKVVTPENWERDFALHLGSTFSLAHTLDQMLYLRPRNRFEDLDSVYLVGGGTHPGSGLPVIFESARISSRLLLEDFGASTSWMRGQEVPQPISLGVAS